MILGTEEPPVGAVHAVDACIVCVADGGHGRSPPSLLLVSAAGLPPTCLRYSWRIVLVGSSRVRGLNQCLPASVFVLAHIAGIEPVLQLPVDELGCQVCRRVGIVVLPGTERRVPEVLARPDLMALLDVDGVLPAHTAVHRVEAGHVDGDRVVLVVPRVASDPDATLAPIAKRVLGIERHVALLVLDVLEPAPTTDADPKPLERARSWPDDNAPRHTWRTSSGLHAQARDGLAARLLGSIIRAEYGVPSGGDWRRPDRRQSPAALPGLLPVPRWACCPPATLSLALRVYKRQPLP